jgi:hypothetical protein
LVRTASREIASNVSLAAEASGKAAKSSGEVSHVAAIARELGDRDEEAAPHDPRLKLARAA